MKRGTRKLLRITLAAIAALPLLGLVYVYAATAWMLRRPYEAPMAALHVTETADPAWGEHLAKIVGCWAGCHGAQGEGGYESIPGIRRITAPTLSAVLSAYSDDELVRLIRYGVKRDGRSAVGMYPATMWSLGDHDLASVIAHLRQQPAVPAVPRTRELSLRGRIGLVTGAWQLSADQVDRSAPRWGDLPRTNPFERGRFLASIVCSECHGADYHGDPFEGGPSLAVIAAYSPVQFRQLMRTGRPLDGRGIPEMSWVPEVEFSEQDISDLFHFLRLHHGIADGEAPPQ